MKTEVTPKGPTDPDRAGSTGTEPVLPFAAPFPFFRFHNAYRSVRSDGRRTHLEARDARFENGKLETESFQGTLQGPDVCDRMAGEMDRFFQSYMDFWMRGLAAWLPVRRQD